MSFEVLYPRLWILEKFYEKLFPTLPPHSLILISKLRGFREQVVFARNVDEAVEKTYRIFASKGRGNVYVHIAPLHIHVLSVALANAFSERKCVMKAVEEAKIPVNIMVSTHGNIREVAEVERVLRENGYVPVVRIFTGKTHNIVAHVPEKEAKTLVEKLAETAEKAEASTASKELEKYVEEASETLRKAREKILEKTLSIIKNRSNVKASFGKTPVPLAKILGNEVAAIFL